MRRWEEIGINGLYAGYLLDGGGLVWDCSEIYFTTAMIFGMDGSECLKINPSSSSSILAEA
jgi:hypothetical protein